eukprot:NODE_14464_length_1108_cov_2.195719.p1 GENE.NODE_14464_length_1108_cov_2.195719~~NODE_14464_length_1108_cov_2.195719.p1  ORF type:complete len:255 (+),score=70.29 NODE_14464_length_1108_cov_2.195719:116-880(+)
MALALLEICVDSVESAIAAEEGGAARIELCSGLTDGGVTPSAGLMQAVRRAVRIPVFVLVRPRPGDFLYTENEFAVMLADVAATVRAGCNGVVVGVLQAHGRVDVGRTQRLVEAARPLAVTFHRAFDMACEPLAALEDVVATGATRLLTSGQAATAMEGWELLAQLVGHATGRVVIMPGGGVTEQNCAELARRTGARELHASARVKVDSPMLHRNPCCWMGAEKQNDAMTEYTRAAASVARVRAYLAALAEGTA